MLHFATARRDTTGLAVTVGVHLLLGAVFIGLGVIPITKTRDAAPIRTTNIEEPQHTPPTVEPRFRKDHTSVDVPAPEFDILTSADEGGFSVGPAALGSDGAGDAIAVTLDPPAPLLVAPHLDRRFAASFQPPYPESARRAGEEGRVVLRVLVGPDGRPARVEVDLSSGHSRLDEAAVRYAQRVWRFVPARRGDATTEMWTKVPVLFRLAAN